MKKLILSLIILISLISCSTIKVTDKDITVNKPQCKHSYYRYSYDCKQTGTRIRLYGNTLNLDPTIIKLQ